jgi:succinoglycan biosynthesis protein ExoA
MSPESQPSVSILIPVRNEARHLPALLQTLQQQDYPALGEILLIDGLSTDGTREKIQEVAAADPRFKLIDNPLRVVTHALNLGFEQAVGEVILRLDAHADYAPDYVSQCVAVLEETGAGNVGGPAVPASDGSFIGDVILALHESAFGIGAAKFRQPDAEGWVDTLWPGAYRREALEAAGMHYVEELTRSEDIELNSRLRKAGWGIYITPRIKATYYPRKNLGALCRQNFGNGAAVLHTLKAGLGGVSLRHLVPLGFVLALIVTGLASIWLPWAKWLLLAVLGLYLLADLAFSLRCARRHGLRLLLLLPLAFLLLHLSYGLGSLCGFFTRPRSLT